MYTVTQVVLHFVTNSKDVEFTKLFVRQKRIIHGYNWNAKVENSPCWTDIPILLKSWGATVYQKQVSGPGVEPVCDIDIFRACYKSGKFKLIRIILAA